MADILKLDYINSLPRPLICIFYGGSEWPLQDIDVETGVLRIDVCGLLEVRQIGDVRMFKDADGNEHDPETFYTDYNEPISTAPKDGTEIIGIYDHGEVNMFWSDRPVCILGQINGGHPPGWATCGPNIDYNLPLDAPEHWRRG